VTFLEILHSPALSEMTVFVRLLTEKLIIKKEPFKILKHTFNLVPKSLNSELKMEKRSRDTLAYPLSVTYYLNGPEVKDDGSGGRGKEKNSQ